MSALEASRDAFASGAQFPSRAALRAAFAEMAGLSSREHPLTISEDRSSKSRPVVIMCSKHGSTCIYARMKIEPGAGCWSALGVPGPAD